ncbi:MAG: tetratricopeptide repeat protein [Kiloniellales bacterium]
MSRLQDRARQAFRAGDAAAFEAACKGLLDSDPSNLVALELLGLAALRSGDLGRSEVVLRRALDRHPRAATVLGALGQALARQGRLAEAIDCYRRSLALDPAQAAVHVDLGNALGSQGQIAAATDSFRRALALEPGNAQALVCLGNAQRHLGRPDEAAECYRSALAARPRFLDAEINLGALLCERGALQDAADCFVRALGVDPRSVAGLTNLGVVRRLQGDADAAVVQLRRALELQPSNLQALLHLGRALGALQRWDEALQALEQAAALEPRAPEVQLEIGDALRALRRWRAASAAYLRAIELDPSLARLRRHYYLGLACASTGDFETAAAAMLAPVVHRYSTPAPPPAEPVFRISRFKLIHDLGQLEHLRSHGRLGPDDEAVIAEYRRVLAASPAAGAEQTVAVDSRASPALAANLFRLRYLADAPVWPGGALNKALDTAAIEAAFAARPPGMAVIDDLLEPGALTALQRFCLESTVWWQLEHSSEVGSTLSRGFACPLLLQIAHDLRRAFPSILGRHPFTTMWAYKYFDPQGQEGGLNRSSGRDVHADDGAVSVNLWITPDEANLGPEPGGIDIWDREAPASYFATQSRRERLEVVRPVFAAAGQPRLTIPHLCNRAAIFHSNLLHRTAPHHFRDAYADRRISITIMFGRRAGSD